MVSKLHANMETFGAPPGAAEFVMPSPNQRAEHLAA